MIILMGFPKTGTISFQNLFEKLNFKSYHQMYKNKSISLLMKKQIKLNKNLLDFIPKNERDKTCLTQIDHCIVCKINGKKKLINFWPQLTHYKELYYQNKDAIFILNKRNSKSLLLSFKREMYDNKSLYNRFIKYNNHLLPKNGTNDEKMLYLFKNHYKNIINFFNKKECKFIIYDLETDNINKLKKYIDIKNIKELPHEHKSENK